MAKKNVIKRTRSIRFNDHEWERIVKAAERAGKLPSAFVHDAAMEAAERGDLLGVTRELKEVLRELKKGMKSTK